jgi:hypothetical protein
VGKACKKHEKGTNSWRVLVAKPEGKMIEDNIEMELKPIGWEGVKWTRVAEDRDHGRCYVDAAASLQVSFKYSKFLTS